tara:strand:+ start:1749 stop:2876 length:1128 start_codon:yes stop_codon:yes gene_type:complete
MNFYNIYKIYNYDDEYDKFPNINKTILDKWNEQKEKSIYEWESFKSEVSENCNVGNYNTCRSNLTVKFFLENEELHNQFKNNFKIPIQDLEKFDLHMKNFIQNHDSFVKKKLNEYDIMRPWSYLFKYIFFCIILYLILRIFRFILYQTDQVITKIDKKIYNDEYDESYLKFSIFNKGIYKFMYVNKDLSEGLHLGVNPWTSFFNDKENLKLVFPKSMNSIISMIKKDVKLKKIHNTVVDEYKLMKNDYFKVIEKVKLIKLKNEEWDKNYKNGLVLLETIKENKESLEKFNELERKLNHSKMTIESCIKYLENISKSIKENLIFSKKLFVIYDLNGTLMEYKPDYSMENELNQIIEFSNNMYSYDFFEKKNGGKEN